MCCLFGMLDYKQSLSASQKNTLLSVLATECEVRGTDATGIAYNHNNRMCIYKRPLAARKMRFNVPKDVCWVMGHTRLTTQGNERNNYNNHPFYGSVKNAEFALAHNGVIYNDDELRKDKKLHKTKIKTDSYIAVQLIEQTKALGFNSLAYMAEQLFGSFTITVMDNKNNMYFVKGDNPMCIYHFTEKGMYLYASTEEILVSALSKMHLCLGKHEKVEIRSSEILMITPDGRRAVSSFDDEKLYYLSYYQTLPLSRKSRPKAKNRDYEDEYKCQLQRMADFYGYSEDTVDSLLEEGYTINEVEETICYGLT